MSVRIGSGSTVPGEGWVKFYRGIYTDIDTSSAGFTSVPTYVSSVGGDGTHWNLVGTGAIYSPTITGFRVYVQWHDNQDLAPPHAQRFKFYVNWIGFENP